MNRCLYVLFFGLIINSHLYSQFTLEGIVLDQSNVPLPDVHVQLFPGDHNLVSKRDGTFKLSLESNKYTLRISHISFQDSLLTVNLDKDIKLQISLKPSTNNLQTIDVIHHWAAQESPLTYDNIKEEEFKSKNLGQDLPYLLRRTPSLVVSSDAGHGIGYTGMRIRGTDPTRINVTINGVPLNDSESQGVFWVDLPDFGSSTSSIQIQRGVGSSTNGSGAFGATVNLNTQALRREPHAQVGLGIGSFGTRKLNTQMGTGLIHDKFSLETRLSKIKSNGYIDRADADLTSYFFSGTYFGKKSSLRFNFFGGHEVTYQAWNGVPAQYIDDKKLRTSNTAGTERTGSPHPNEVDDYNQTHLQVIYNLALTPESSIQATAHYTKGMGFFEQYKANQNLANYFLDCLEGDNEDLIRRRWLDNHFYGFMASYNYNASRLDWTLGIAANQYLGSHFGEVTWARTFCNEEQGHRYYDNEATKNEMSTYSKWHYSFNSKLVGYLDLQIRIVDYEFLGLSNEGNPLGQKASHQFFNPKIGLSYLPKQNQKYYASVAVAHREPNRNDYTESNTSAWPKPEQLINTELGWATNHRNWSLLINGYHMLYKDQLVLTGEINDVGAYTRSNIDKSFRMGVETDFSLDLSQKLSINTAITASQNKVLSFTEYIDDWDNGIQQMRNHQKTDLAFSPNWIGHTTMAYVFIGHRNAASNATLLWESSWVSRQYLDNTSSQIASIPSYWIHDLGLNIHITPKWAKSVDLNLQVNNLFSTLYSSNGWIYRFNSDDYNPTADDPHARNEGSGFYNLSGYYPQATRHFMAGLNISL